MRAAWLDWLAPWATYRAEVAGMTARLDAFEDARDRAAEAADA